jgi:hypothetical protein
MKLMRHIKRIGGMRNTYECSARNLEGTERHRRRLEDNIKIDIKEI